jgi:uncharacterized protein (DUF1778 family)
MHSQVMTKSVNFTIRVTPQMRELMNRAAITDNRSVTQLIETLILKFAQERGIALPKDIQQKATKR